MNFSDLNYAVYSAGSQRLEIVQPWSLSLSILPLRWEGGNEHQQHVYLHQVHSRSSASVE